MERDNYIALQFPSCSVNEGFARIAVAGFAAQLDPTLEELGDIKTAVSEAVTNAIVHAYPDEIGRISIKAKRSGQKCIGCPHSKECGSSCSCNCNKEEK